MAYYLKYILHNTEPVRIADDSLSEQGQTACLRYIPGSTIRGYVISEILKRRGNFENLKGRLFSDKTAFLNAYLSVDGKYLLPSPKGFYEDKTMSEGAKAIKNVLTDGELDEGSKRSVLGTVCDIDTDKGQLSYYSVETDSELKIQIGQEKNMFRNAFIEKGQFFAGAIASDEKGILEEIKGVLGDSILIGNARTSGYGKCRLELSGVDENNPYAHYQTSGGLEGEAYLFLLSDTVMKDDAGEYCGLNLKELESILGIRNLRIAYSATSVHDVRGYNRTLGIHMPSVMMYEKGSVFKLAFEGEISMEKAKLVADNGIGERKNEGCGRVLLMDSSYEKIATKIKGEVGKIAEISTPEKESVDDETLRLIAGTHYRNKLKRAMQKYVVDNVRDKGGISDSKIRAIEPLIVSNRTDYKEARRIIDDYYEHELKKQAGRRVHKNRGDIKKSEDRISYILDTDINELLSVRTKDQGKVMGISVADLMDEEEAGRFKLELILSELRYDNKGDGKNG